MQKYNWLEKVKDDKEIILIIRYWNINTTFIRACTNCRANLELSKACVPWDYKITFGLL